MKNLTIAFIAALGLTAAACGSDVSRDDVIDGLTEEGFTAEQAGCLYDELADRYSDDDLQALLQADTDEDIADAGLDVDEASTAVYEGVLACDALS